MLLRRCAGAISAAAGALPKNLPSRRRSTKPTLRKHLLTLSLSSDLVSTTELDHYAEDVIAQQVVADVRRRLVDFHGPQRPSVRIRLDPDKVARAELTLGGRAYRLGQQTSRTEGSLSDASRTIVLDATDQLIDAPAYRGMVVAYATVHRSC